MEIIAPSRVTPACNFDEGTAQKNKERKMVLKITFIGNLVSRALSPGFGNGAPHLQSKGKRPRDEVASWEVNKFHFLSFFLGEP